MYTAANLETRNGNPMWMGGGMEIDRRAFIASLGGAASASLMDSEARADALEDYLSEQLDAAVAGNQAGAGNQGESKKFRSEERRVGKECRL